MMKETLTALTVTILAAGWAHGATNTAAASSSASNHVVHMAWDSNVVHTIFLREGVISITSAGHEGVVRLHTTNRVYVMPCNTMTNHGLLEVFVKEAEKKGRMIPTLFLD